MAIATATVLQALEKYYVPCLRFVYFLNARGRLRTCTFHEFTAKEEEFYPEMYVCIMYEDLLVRINRT